MATELTDNNFQAKVLESEQAVIVDFWADWCAPCHMVAPILDQIAEERDVRLAKVNVDEQPALAARFGVRSIPTIVRFDRGEPTAAALGAQPKRRLEKALGLSG
jgi:thioredoxin 1